MAISEAIQSDKCCNICELYLFCNKIGNAGWNTLAKALPQSKLVYFDIGGNEIGIVANNNQLKREIITTSCLINIYDLCWKILDNTQFTHLKLFLI